jgi:hypothetical protein
MAGIQGNEEILQKLGKHKTGKGCLYINKLDDVNIEVLKILMVKTINRLGEMYP